MVGGSQLEGKKIDPDRNQMPDVEKSIIKPKRGAAESSLEHEIGSGGNALFPNMSNASLAIPPVAYRARLDEFKIRDDVKMYRQLPDYDKFQGFDLPNEMDSSAIQVGIFTGPPKHSRSA